MGSSIHKNVHEETRQASLGGACGDEEEEADMAEKGRRCEISIQGVEIWGIDGLKPLRNVVGNGWFRRITVS
jgi:hypothetical protein